MPIGLLNNDFIKDLRKKLLLKNLNPTTEANLGGLSSLNIDRGTPAQTSLPQGDYIPLNQESVTTLGFYPLKSMSLKNRYAPTTYPVHEITDNLTLGGNIGTYDTYVRTNTSQNVFNFDLRRFVLGNPSIAGYNDTPLGIIGAEQLKYNLEANIAQNTIKNTVGRINLNLFSLLNGEEFLIRDYQISELPNTGLGFVGNLLSKYIGYEIPKSLLPADAIGFLDTLFSGKVRYADCTLLDLVFKDQARMDGIYRNNLLLRYTGKGNRVQLFNLLGINKFRPNYDDPNGSNTGLNRIFGFLQQQKRNDSSAYTRLEQTRRSSGMLPVMRTQNISVYGNDKTKGAYQKNDPRSVLQTNGIPKYTWTDKDIPGGAKRFMFSIENLAWIEHTDGLPDCEIGNGDKNSDDDRPGRIMWFPPYGLEFDENVTVAWDRTNFVGRGEPIFTYNNTTRSGSIRFKIVVDHPSIINELRNNSAWSESDFLKFFKGCNIDNENFVDYALSFLDEKTGTMSKEMIDDIENKIVREGQKNFEKKFNETTKPGGTDSFTLKIYFPYGNSTVNPNYQNGSGTVTSASTDSNLPINGGQSFYTGIDFGLNSSTYDDGTLGFQNPEAQQKISSLNSMAQDIDHIDITIIVANTNLNQQDNFVLNSNIFTSTASWIKSQLTQISPNNINIKDGGYETVPVPLMSNITNPDQTGSRFARIEVKVYKKDLKITGATTEETTTYTDKNVQDKVRKLLIKTFSPVYMECDYFKYLETNQPFIFSQLKDKLKFFNPGFHSTTPEGLNSRLTFLHQCTRQGPAISQNGAKSNLAFGRPPICILRIGDFFHTKMVIESMSITYDDGVLWDLNPEGIGVQPRIASVSLTVTYLGGQSLSGPIRELQNALGFNFYANTETFQHAPEVINEIKQPIDKRTTGIPFSNAATDPTINSNTLNYLNGNFGFNNPSNYVPQTLGDQSIPPSQTSLNTSFVGPPTNPYNLTNYTDSNINTGNGLLTTNALTDFNTA